MKPRFWIWLGAVAGAVIAGLLAPFALRHVPFFQVRRIEVVGVRYLSPERIMAALELEPEQNLFDPLDQAAERLRGMPGVLSAELGRELPGSLRVTVVEKTPVVFVSGPDGMVALDCDGRPLPFDPTASGLDLPLVARAEPTLVRTLCIVRAGDSTLYREVNWARNRGEDAVTLDLGRQRVVLRSLPTTDEIKAVGSVRRHLTARGRPADELDARFAGWVVARWDRT